MLTRPCVYCMSCRARERQQSNAIAVEWRAETIADYRNHIVIDDVQPGDALILVDGGMS